MFTISSALEAGRTSALRGWLLGVALSLATGGVASAQTLAPPGGAFTLAHGGQVDSGVLSVLGTFTSTQTSVAPALLIPMFDASVGRLTGVSVSVNTTASTFAVSPSGVLSLISFASANRALNYTINVGTTSATDGAARLDSGGVLLTLLGLGTSEIGGAQLAKVTTFSSPADLANFVGSGNVSVTVSASDTLSVSTLLSLLNGAGFRGSGQAAGTVSLTYTYVPYPTAGQVSIAKTASVATARSGGTITYTLVFTNNGVSPVDALSIRDVTPTYTTYQSPGAVVAPAGMAVFTSAPAVGAGGAVVWTFTGRLAASASGRVQYSVVVD